MTFRNPRSHRIRRWLSSGWARWQRARAAAGAAAAAVATHTPAAAATAAAAAAADAATSAGAFWCRSQWARCLWAGSVRRGLEVGRGRTHKQHIQKPYGKSM